MKRGLINYLGLLGFVSFISYTVAVVFTPFVYPGYNWMSQAVSDLSARDAPSAFLWSQLTTLYGVCGVVCCTLTSVFIQDKLNRPIRYGIYLFTIMNWISYVGYGLFPLSSSGYIGTVQDFLHTYVVTLLVVLLSIISLVLIIIGGLKEKRYKSLSLFALFSLCHMIVGAIGVSLVPEAYFGIPERLSVFSVSFFTAILGMYLFRSFKFDV